MFQSKNVEYKMLSRIAWILNCIKISIKEIHRVHSSLNIYIQPLSSLVICFDWFIPVFSL